jgi:hypothetical protein
LKRNAHDRRDETAVMRFLMPVAFVPQHAGDTSHRELFRPIMCASGPLVTGGFFAAISHNSMD